MKLFLSLALILLIAFSITGQEEPKQILESGDVEHFIETFPKLEKDFDEYGLRYEAREGNVTIPEAVKAKDDFLSILKKHGWDENFFQKFGAIMLGYSTIVYGKEMKTADSKLDRSIKEIDDNPNLTPEMKTQLKEQMRLVKSAMEEQKVNLKKSIHQNDLDIVRPYIEEIKNVIDKKN
ncbi:MAG: hypothetical protein HND52_10620 [Ignavibacteriae bacterium]|nr:hypothetical protein [Ignavibacteriota bacterium]NOG98401.1 hypothetical protein [Ignavibacteriota bacterium]